jgi:hypothetical protein
MSDIFNVIGPMALCCAVLPLSGWWLAARLRNDSLLRFTAACLGGVTTLAAAELLAYGLRFPQWVAVAMVAVAIGVSLRPLIAAIRRGEFAWDAWLAWAGTSLMLIAATLRYAVHGLPETAWDWYEHWLRALVFLRQWPICTEFGNDYVHYIMPARGPLFNGAAALLLYGAGSAQYWVFQIFATTLNALVCLPFALLLRTVGGLGRRAALVVAAAVTTMVPFNFWNNTFTWTKELTAAFILLGIHEYLVAYREGNRNGMAMSLAYLAPGFLCHYLTLPYAAVLGLHLVLTVPIRALPFRALVRAGSVWVLLIAPWFGFMIWSFGAGKTLGANTTLGSAYTEKVNGGTGIPQGLVLLGNLCVDVLPKTVCLPILPPEGPSPCAQLTIHRGDVSAASSPCVPAFPWTGIYNIARYSGLLAVLLAAAFSVRPLLSSRRSSDSARFLMWVLGAGLILNALPVRWFLLDRSAGFSQNLHAWLFVFIAVVVRGVMRAPRPMVPAVLLAMAAEYTLADLEYIRAQAVVLPLANDAGALRGFPPAGQLFVRTTSADFRAPNWYYWNYVYKVGGGAIYFRDAHPESFARVSVATLAAGLLLLGAAAVGWRKQDSSRAI